MSENPDALRSYADQLRNLPDSGRPVLADQEDAALGMLLAAIEIGAFSGPVWGPVRHQFKADPHIWTMGKLLLKRMGEPEERWMAIKDHVKRNALFFNTVADAIEAQAGQEGWDGRSGDDDAFISAKMCLDDRIPSHKRLLKVLMDNPEIRRRKPSPQRLKVHAGDLARWKDTQSEADWDKADSQAVVEAIEKSKVKARQAKRAVGKPTTSPTALIKKITGAKPR